MMGMLVNLQAFGQELLNTFKKYQPHGGARGKVGHLSRR